MDGPAVRKTVKEIRDVGGKGACFEVDLRPFKISETIQTLHKRYGGLSGRPIGSARLAAYSAGKFAAAGFLRLSGANLRRKSRVRTLPARPFYISTGMSEGVKTKIPFLLPILKPESVAVKIVEVINKGKERPVLPPPCRPCRLQPIPLFFLQT